MRGREKIEDWENKHGDVIKAKWQARCVKRLESLFIFTVAGISIPTPQEARPMFLFPPTDSHKLLSLFDGNQSRTKKVNVQTNSTEQMAAELLRNGR